MVEARLELLVAFMVGVVIPLVAALLAHALNRRHERQRTLQERRFDVYMRLMDLHAQYFWYSAQWTRSEPVPQEMRDKCKALAWELADKLRGIDEDEHVDEALDVLFRIDYAATAHEREQTLTALIDRMASVVNPRYAKKMREISEANIRATAADVPSNAPGMPWPLV